MHRPPARHFAPMLLLATALIGLSGCAITSRSRTLPPSIRSVTVPMVVNRSAEPGIEEKTTVLTQKEFLADGRLDLRPLNDADAVIEVIITDFLADSASLDSDDFPRRTRYTVEAEVRIVQNIPGRPLVGGVRSVRASHSSTSDKRRITFEPEPDAHERLLETLARRIVREVLTGAYTGGA